MTHLPDDELNDPSLAAFLADDGEAAATVRAALGSPLRVPEGLAAMQIGAALAAFDEVQTQAAAAVIEQRSAAQARARSGRRRSWLLAGFGSVAALGGLALFIGNTANNSARDEASAPADAALAKVDDDARMSAESGKVPSGGADQESIEVPAASEGPEIAAPAETEAATRAPGSQLESEAADLFGTTAYADPIEFNTIEELSSYPWLAADAPRPSEGAPANDAPSTDAPATEALATEAPAVASGLESCPTAPGSFAGLVTWQGQPGTAYVLDGTVIVLDASCAVLVQAVITPAS